MEKKQFLNFLKDQRSKNYSDELILIHLKEAWSEIENKCNCQYNEAKKYIKRIVHNKNCPLK